MPVHMAITAGFQSTLNCWYMIRPCGGRKKKRKRKMFTTAFVAFIPAAALRTGDCPVCRIPLNRNFTPLSCSPGSASSPGAEGRRTLKVRHRRKNALRPVLEGEGKSLLSFTVLQSVKYSRPSVLFSPCFELNFILMARTTTINEWISLVTQATSKLD